MKKKLFVAALLLGALLLTACQQTVPTVVVQTPHPAHATQANALYFVDSADVGRIRPPYDYTSGHFTINAAAEHQVQIVATCYGPDQSNYLGAPYQIHVNVYKGGVEQQKDAVLATCKQGNPSTSTGLFDVTYTGRDYYLVILSGGPWTVEVDPA